MKTVVVCGVVNFVYIESDCRSVVAMFFSFF